MPETDSVKAPEDGDVVAVSDAELRLWHYLADQDIYCPRCGYNLRGLRTDACPECDQRLELVIRLADARIGMLIATLVGLTLGVGGAGEKLVLVLLYGRPPSSGYFAEACFVVFVVGTIALLALACRRGRAWFGRMNRSVQTRLAILAWGLPVAYVIIVLMAARII